MQRFFGMMPSGEIEREEIYRETDTGVEFQIQAGPHGYSIVWGDGSTLYADNDAPTDENFAIALELAKEEVSEFECITREESDEDIGGEC